MPVPESTPSVTEAGHARTQLEEALVEIKRVIAGQEAERVGMP